MAGESDFHALDYVHDTIYGYDSTNGRLRTSRGGTTWQDKAAIEALDIAVSPQDPGLVLATTADGVARSTDGGATWKTLATVPGGQPQALTAEAAGHVLAATQSGVYESTDGASSFTKRLDVEASGGH